METFSKNLKIGLIPLHSFARPGGVKNHVISLQREFQKREIFSKVIVPKRSKGERYGRNIIFFGKSIPISINGSESDFSFSFNLPVFRKILMKENFNILHFHNFGLLTYQILTYQNLFNFKKKRPVLNVLTFHSNFDPQKTAPFKQFPPLLKIFKNITNEKIDGIIGIAPFNLKIFKGFSGPTTVIPNGIDLKKFNPGVKKIEKYSDDKINLLFIGRIEERKGLIYLLRAYQILKKKFGNLRLIIIGEGELKEECENFVKFHRLKDIIFEGKVGEEKIPSYYSSSDVFCSPAIFGESFGIVLLEAMASGKPVVAFANQGYKRVLSGKGGDFLVKPKDWKGLARKIEILIRDKSKRQELGRWGRRASRKYSWEKIADRVLNFYQKVYQRKYENH